MTTFFHPGDGQDTSKRALGWADFFGDRGHTNVTNKYSGYPRETLALPDVYKGSNPYLTNLMLNFISEEELVPTRILLPLRHTEHETSVTWDEFHFNNTLLGAVPEEGISRLVTQQISERRDHYVRYGLAFMIEHGFMQSPKGQMTYKANLQQIRDAILQSLYIGVIEALLRCKTNSQFFIQSYGRQMSALSARRRIEIECESFAEIQKSDHGWEMLNSRAQRTLRIAGVTPDAWVVDDGVKKYIASRRESWAYFLHGPDGEALRRENQGVGNPKSLDIASNCLIFETKQFNLPTIDEPVNITSRRRSIGEYMISFPHLDYASCGKYSSAMRDIMIYDEDRDGFTKLTVAEGLEHCQRFSADGSLDPHGFNPRSHGNDMFFTPEHPAGVEFFGQMSDKDMPTEALRAWVFSVSSQFDVSQRAELMTNLNALKTLVNLLDGESGVEFYPDYWEGLHLVYTTFDNPEDGSYYDKASGFMRLSNLLDHVIPYGYGSYAGICEIAKSDLVLAPDAQLAKKAVDMIKQRLDAVCYGNAFTQNTAIPFYFRHKTTEAAILCNLLHKRLPPVVVEINLKKSSEEVFALKVNDQKFRQVLTDADSTSTAFLRIKSSMNLNLSKFQANDETVPSENSESWLKADALSEKVTHAIMEIYATLSPSYREVLVRLLNKLVNYEQLERMFNIIMKGMDGQTWYTVSRAIDSACDVIVIIGQPTTFSLDSSKIDVITFMNKLQDKTFRDEMDPSEQQAGKVIGSNTISGKKKTVITQLTCSPTLANFLAGSEENKIKNIFKSYESLKSIKTSYNVDASEDELRAIGGVQFAAGPDTFGDDEGLRREARFDQQGQPSRSFLGIKRKDIEAAPDAFRHTYEAWWEKNPRSMLAERIKDVQREFAPGSLDCALGLAFMGNAVNKKCLERFVKTGCVFPFNVLYARPFQTYSMSTGVCMKAGDSTGETLVGHCDFQLGDNIVQKLHYGNFTFYSKSVVYRQQQVFLAPNMFATGYAGGTGSKMFSCSKDYVDYMESGSNQVNNKSIFAMLTPYSSCLYTNPLDITGRHGGNLMFLDPKNGDEAPELHFATAPFYKKFWGWTESQMDAPGRCSFDNDDDGVPNTICFQGHQSLYNPANGGLYDIVMKNTGHWGPNVYPGVGKVRNGHQKVVETVPYNNLYGGGGNLSGMLK
jgi:hypothetical protein